MTMLTPDPEAVPYQAFEPVPLWDYTGLPHTDDICRQLIDNAVLGLILVRGGDPRDPGATISVLVSLIAEAEDRLPDAVADARDRGYRWWRVAERLATSVSIARHRYADYARWRRLNPQP
jgi:hypothetical protein